MNSRGPLEILIWGKWNCSKTTGIDSNRLIEDSNPPQWKAQFVPKLLKSEDSGLHSHDSFILKYEVSLNIQGMWEIPRCKETEQKGIQRNTDNRDNKRTVKNVTDIFLELR